jgi:tetratricopeptide (TPR) repeat protein
VRTALVGVGCVLITGALACRWLPGRSLQAPPVPDLARADAGVQAQVRGRHEALVRAIADRADAPELARAFGQYGMVLQAAEFFDAAEPCYLEAQTLDPEDVHWPYYLAGVYKSRGDTDKAEAAYKRVLQLRPDDVAALIWLGRLHLDQGRPEDAEPLLLKAYSLSPRAVAILAGLGRVEVAKRDYPQAVKYLEDALAIDPDAESLHAPLAAAYRGLGQLDKAQPHLRQWRNRDIPVQDPLQQELDLLLDSGLSNELRGIRAFEIHDYPQALGFFRRGLELTPGNTPLSRSLRHKLGTALYLTGDSAGARMQFEEVARQAPPGMDESASKAHYSLGVLLASQGDMQGAVQHLLASLQYQPNYVEAHLAAADVLRRSGKGEASLSHYRDALAINPRQTTARLGYGMALVQLRRYQEARAWLEESVRLYGDRVDLKIALARLLASCPDARVRDGARALTMAQQMFDAGEKSTSLGETIAMALAEQGNFPQAIGIQRDIIAAAQKAGQRESVQRMTANLELYEHRQPCRTPWFDDDLVSVPTAGASFELPAAQPSAPVH